MTTHTRPRLAAAALAACLVAAGAGSAVASAGSTPQPAPTLGGLYNPSPDLVSAQDNVSRLVSQAQAAAATFTEANERAQRATDEATHARAAASAAQKQADAARAELGQYAATAYITGGATANLAATLDAGSPTEMVSRQNALEAVVGSSADLVRTLRDAQGHAEMYAAQAAAAQDAATEAAQQARDAATQAQATAAEAEQVVAAMVASQAAAQQAAIIQARAAAYATGAGANVVTADGVPVAYLAFGNGRIPPQALTPISTDPAHLLWGPAAQAFDALQAAATADGVKITVSDAYRTYEVQVALAGSKGLYSDGGLAATPGTSNHGWGIAVDLNLDAAAQAWMGQHAAAYGFIDDVPRESWHWRFYVTG